MKTLLFVAMAHIVIAAVALRGTLPPPQSRSIVVQTVRLRKAPPAIRHSSGAIARKAASPAPRQAQSPPAKKRPAPAKRPPCGKSSASELFAKAREQLKALSHCEKASIKACPIPLCSAALPLGKIDEGSYAERLIDRLTLALCLPEYGPVTVELTLSKGGRVTQLTIQSSESHKNSAYVKEQLPKLTFEPLTAHFPNEETHTFIVVLSHEI